LPKTGIEPISKSYKEFILPIKLFRPLPWERIELTSLYLQNSALTTKQPRLKFLIFIIIFIIFYFIFNLNWRKIDSNYHICNANTTDYHYQISPLLDIDSLLRLNKNYSFYSINLLAYLKVIVKLMLLI
jgi:hypothetical protein